MRSHQARVRSRGGNWRHGTRPIFRLPGFRAAFAAPGDRPDPPAPRRAPDRGPARARSPPATDSSATASTGSPTRVPAARLLDRRQTAPAREGSRAGQPVPSRKQRATGTAVCCDVETREHSRATAGTALITRRSRAVPEADRPAHPHRTRRVDSRRRQSTVKRDQESPRAAKESPGAGAQISLLRWASTTASSLARRASAGSSGRDCGR